MGVFVYVVQMPLLCMAYLGGGDKDLNFKDDS
jgi:hypothetical protein